MAPTNGAIFVADQECIANMAIAVEIMAPSAETRIA
jgi:hypothetical protein